MNPEIAFLKDVLDFIGRNLFNKSHPEIILGLMASETLMGRLLFEQFEYEAWNEFLNSGGNDFEVFFKGMGDRLDLTAEEFKDYGESDYPKTIEGVEAWKLKYGNDPISVLQYFSGGQRIPATGTKI